MEIQIIQDKIFELRGQKVMLDFDLAILYDVGTKALNQNTKRNASRFPSDFMFQLTSTEWENMRSQFVTASQNKRNISSLPYAFTEHGITMLASTLKSEKAVQTNIAIVRAFIALREFANQYKEIAESISQLESKYDLQFDDVYKALNHLLKKDTLEIAQHKRKRIGYKPQ